MTTLRKAAEKALAAYDDNSMAGTLAFASNMEALRAALAEPEPEPVAWTNASWLSNPYRGHYSAYKTRCFDVPLYTKAASMNNVIDLSEHRPHLRGAAKCLACKHEWEAVAPIGVIWLDCPECGAEKGRLVGACQREGLHWTCNCGNDLFYVSPDGTYCPNCGDWQYGVNK